MSTTSERWAALRRGSARARRPRSAQVGFIAILLVGLCGPARAVAPPDAPAAGSTPALVAPTPQFPHQLTSALQHAKEVHDIWAFSDQQEAQLGAQVSEKLRERYGVVQDPAIHRYVTLVGMVLAHASSRPNLPWTFIVLDTDGVNAFAAPGGFIHITRGALALLQNESELACVLGHEISHVTEKHTINAIRRQRGIDALTAQMSQNELMNYVSTQSYDIVFQGMYDRGDELDADAKGIALASKVGYAPTGLGAFLARLDARNKGLQTRNGLFASHPATQERIEKAAQLIASQHLTGTAIVEARYRENVHYPPTAISAIAMSTSGAAGLADGTSSSSTSGSTSGTTSGAASGASSTTSQPTAASGSGKFGLGGLGALSGEKKSSETIASAGARGSVPDRDAKGGSNPAIVHVTVTDADIAAFKKGIA